MHLPGEWTQECSATIELSSPFFIKRSQTWTCPSQNLTHPYCGKRDQQPDSVPALTTFHVKDTEILLIPLAYVLLRCVHRLSKGVCCRNEEFLANANEAVLALELTFSIHWIMFSPRYAGARLKGNVH